MVATILMIFPRIN